jgi:hypothetical protein
VQSTATRIVVIDFDPTDPNPPSFKALVFDETGARQTAVVYWTARGIV